MRREAKPAAVVGGYCTLWLHKVIESTGAACRCCVKVGQPFSSVTSRCAFSTYTRQSVQDGRPIGELTHLQ